MRFLYNTISIYYCLFFVHTLVYFMCYNMVIALEVLKMARRVLRSYPAFSPKQHGTPWVAVVGLDGKIDFSKKAGCYTGGSGTGHKGDIVVYLSLIHI